MQVHFTQSNGYQTFVVFINNKDKVASIFKLKEGDDKNWRTSAKFVKSFKYAKVFVGKDSSLGAKWDGNTLLFQLPDKKTYIFIEREIKKITILEPVVRYVSKIGNSAVAYPYAVTKNNYYLIIEGNKKLSKKEVPTGEDPYNIYYKH